MPRSLLLFTLFICLFVTSCGFKEKHNAQDFYNRAGGINDSLDEMTEHWHNMLNTAVVRKNFNDLSAYRITLGTFISNSRSTVANMEATSENEKVKTNLETVLANQSDKVANIYPRFELFSALTPKDTINNNLKLLGDDLNSEKASALNIRNLLKAYAAKYGLKK
ncbi:MAG: hypothetical protein H7257_10575 [Taibaiella sp.]|nr:hypothetical protein [Taibaiella sp.]